MPPLGSHAREKKMWHDHANFYPNCWAYRVRLTSARKENQSRLFAILLMADSYILLMADSYTQSSFS